MPPPDVVLNTDPTGVQRFTITVTGETSQIAYLRGTIQYNIVDDSCVPIDYGMALGGIKPTFTKYAILNIVSLGDDKYEAMVYPDLYSPSDYYGLGVCNWRITAIDIHIIRIDGKKEIAGIRRNDLNYGARSSISCGLRVGGFGCAPSRVVSASDYKLIISSSKK